MATVYHELGATVTIVELMDQLIPGADKDLIGPLTKRVSQLYENIYLKTSVTNVEARPEGLVVFFDGAKAPSTDTFDRMLVAVGRRPRGEGRRPPAQRRGPPASSTARAFSPGLPAAARSRSAGPKG